MTSRQFMIKEALPIGIALIVLGGLIAYTWVLHEVFTSKVPGANDFFSRWAATSLFFSKGWNPYSDQTSVWMQTAIYGRPALPTEDASLFAYPFYTIFVIAPYTWLSTYAWAQAAWQVTLQVLMLLNVFILFTYLNWQPRPLLFGALVLWTVLFYPTARSIILGQIGVMIFTLTLASMWLAWRAPLSTMGDAVCGVLLALSTIKPQMQFLFIPLLLVWVIRERRWIILVAFALSMALFLGVSFVLLPNWLSEWIEQIQQYPGYTPPAVLTIITQDILQLGELAVPTEFGLGALLVVYWLYECWIVLKSMNPQQIDWLVGLTLVITHLVAPRTATTHFIVFLYPLYVIFQRLTRSGLAGTASFIAIMVVLGIGMWWLFLTTLVGNQEANLVHIPLPIFMLVLVVTTRPTMIIRATQ